MQGLKGTIFFCKQGQQILYDCSYFEKFDWCSHRFCILKRFEFFPLFVLISFYSDVILNIFVLEKVRAKYIFYFKLLRESPIDQIVQTVFGYSLRKE